MAPLIPSAKITLSYPLYACDFDPLDSSRLLVAGGGGASKTGVGNKITVLDTSSPSVLREAGEIELSIDEDNVTSFAVGQKKGKATLVYAGVNSSPRDVEKGQNAHFRILALEDSTKTDAGVQKVGKFSEVSRTIMFKGDGEYTYQRVTRLSKPYPGHAQLGAVATGDAKTSQVLLFDTSVTSPPVSRGAVESNKEAVDVDILQTGDDEYLFAYADVHDIYVKKISKETDDQEPACVYITPASRSAEKVTIPSFRSIRWLAKDLIVMLTNIHSNGGVVLQILRTPPSGKGQSRIVQSHRLPDNIKRATGMAVANLTPPLTPSASQGYTQFIIAVAAQGSSVSLFKVDLQAALNVSMVMKIKPFRTFKSVHPAVITSLSFSNFIPPTQPITATTPPQYLKLASVGVSNTVVVHTLPLFPVPLSVKRGQSKSPRYVVALPSTAAATSFMLGISVFGIVLAAIIIQAFLEVRGGVPVYLSARNHLPVTWQEALGRPYEFPSGYNSISSEISSDVAKATGYTPEPDTKATTLKSGFFDKLKQGAARGVYMLKESGDTVGVHLHNEESGAHSGKFWDDLSQEQKQIWKRKLKDAGHWAEDMGETILKGVLFAEIGGAVGQAVAGG